MTEPIFGCIKYILFPSEIMHLRNNHQQQLKPLCKKLMRNFIMSKPDRTAEPIDQS